MNIRTRLLLVLLSLSTLTLIVGIIFYSQLKNLIEPLTPQSIPASVEQLENTIIKNNFVYHLLYQQQATQLNLEDYVLSNNITNLQDYYMNQTLFMQLLESANKIYPDVFEELKMLLNQIIIEENNIIKQMKSNNLLLAKQSLSSSRYMSLRHRMVSMINNYHVSFDILTDEKAVITVKLAAVNTNQVLLKSMNTTIIIFLYAIVISLLLIIFGTNAVWRPIKLLRNNMDDISRKNLDIPVNNSLLLIKGEIGDLARSFGKLISTLRTTTVSRDKLLIEIQKRMESEEHLRQTAKDLEESNLELDQFAYSASHDLRAPLKGIESLCEWIREDCYAILPEESQKHFDLLLKRTKRLDALIHGILEYSRAGKHDAQKELIDLNKLLVDIIDSLIPPKNIQITIDTSLPKMMTYKAMITQVFQNLLSNAIKFMDKDKGYIHIGYEELNDYYKFYVKDNGAGIDPKFHKKMFDLFQVLQSRDVIEGSGIGLALVKKIIDKHGGMIEIDSAPLKGSTFYFTWPKK